MKINFNDTVTVVLTAYGAHVFNVAEDRLSRIIGSRGQKWYSPGETVKGQLWFLLHKLQDGDHVWNAGPQSPFEGPEFEVPVKD